MLQAAAVLGVSFDEVLLQAVAGDADAVALERLVEADLMRDAGHGREGGRYRFTHALRARSGLREPAAVAPQRAARTRRPGA